jgi:hypothetical protein
MCGRNAIGFPFVLHATFTNSHSREGGNPAACSSTSGTRRQSNIATAFWKMKLIKKIVNQAISQKI